MTPEEIENRAELVYPYESEDIEDKDDREANRWFNNLQKRRREGYIKALSEGETKSIKCGISTRKIIVTISEETLDRLGVCAGDEIEIQIRKKP